MAKKQTIEPSIYWHDYETFGINPKTDRPSQFAGIRTDLDLNIISEPMMIYSKPANDFLPDPDACLITGITPQKTIQDGMPETIFIQSILDEFSHPNTCVAGYNSLRFDDEFTRFTLYRNLYPAYDREWQNGNSRWDIIDLVRVTHALRPDGINWPTHDDGRPSYRLEQLTQSNNLMHEAAHDALSDVLATISIAKLIKEKQPALYDYYFNNRQKRNVVKLLDAQNKKPVLHTSSMFSTDYYCTALIVPLIQHPTNSNAVICYDLRYDPHDLLSLPADEIRNRLYTKKQDLPEGHARIALKTVHLNKCPVIVPAKIDEFVQNRLSIDKAASHQHLEQIRNNAELEHKLVEVFSYDEFDKISDPDQSLYSGPFFSDRDKRLMEEVHKQDPFSLANKSYDFTDNRLEEMLFRYRARNYPGLLSEEESKKWNLYRYDRLTNENNPWMTTLKFKDRINELKNEESISPDKLDLLDELLSYEVSLIEEISHLSKQNNIS